jgi:hypothetical protein
VGTSYITYTAEETHMTQAPEVQRERIRALVEGPMGNTFEVHLFPLRSKEPSKTRVFGQRIPDGPDEDHYFKTLIFQNRQDLHQAGINGPRVKVDPLAFRGIS